MTIALRLGLLQRTHPREQRNQRPWTTCVPRTRTDHQQYQQRQQVGGGLGYVTYIGKQTFFGVVYCKGVRYQIFL